MCYLSLLDKGFSKHFTEKYREKDALFGANDIEEIIKVNYQEFITKYDMKMLSQFFRLKYGSNNYIITS